MTPDELRALAKSWWVPSSARTALREAADTIEALQARPPEVDDRIAVAQSSGHTYILAMTPRMYGRVAGNGVNYQLISAPAEFTQPERSTYGRVPKTAVVGPHTVKIDGRGEVLTIGGTQVKLADLLNQLGIVLHDLAGKVKWI